MKALCIRNTKRLVKGAIYDVARLSNLNSPTQRKPSPKIWVKINGGFCLFTMNNFTLENGDDFPKINWESDEYRQIANEYSQSRIDSKSIKKGDYVVYRRNSHKALVTNNKYKVTDVREIQHKSYGGSTWSELEIQVEGSSRYYKQYSFRKCTVQETREISLGEVLGEETDVSKVLDKTQRKIDQYDDTTKERILTKVLFSAALDPNRNNMTIVQWACAKIGSNLSIEEKDFETIINKSLRTILEYI